VTESKWHGSQQLTPQKDGSLLAEFDLDNTEEVKRWIQSFGKHAVVLEPEQLRTEILGEIDALRLVSVPPQATSPDVEGEVAMVPLR
jgi:predicted DNA-binding transcriptional regulator YafY